MTISRPLRFFISAVLTAFIATALTACGGGSASIGGTVYGLGSGLTLVLQNNNADTLTITGTSATSITFTFATDIASTKTYNATVLKQPVGQTCTVTSGSGTVSTTTSTTGTTGTTGTTTAVDVTSIVVTCTTTSTIVGTVSGLKTGVAVTLASNGSTLVLGNGSFSFPGVLIAGTTYAVTVTAQPAGQSCSIGNGTGTVLSNATSTVTVLCT